MKSPNPRSFLFVPGDRPERFDKALQSGADAVILDLEDAVSPENKIEARQAVQAWLTPDRSVLIRVNALGTSWFEADTQLGKLRGVAGIVLPKAEGAADIVELVSRSKSKVPVYPLIESAKGMVNAMEVARAPFVRQLMFGTLDFCADLHLASDGDELDHFRAELVLTSRVAGVAPPIDGVTPSITDVASLGADTVRAKRWGFAGKLCIHPRQVAIVNAGFAPSNDELAWARRVIEAFEAADGAAVAVDGKMVDRPVVQRAQSILDSIVT
ncbi:HpcH/HpaI aldolase/citrate lyase family protein [Burkholderia cenocepacia]|uniref:HpcH/HpaI aldolase/citrate lyase family protein n=1 Tax=Burkholderia TaxID=32008 RepID=UPI001041630F|nr:MULTISPECIES: CoA ester lyase [Burkholderia]